MELLLGTRLTGKVDGHLKFHAPNDRVAALAVLLARTGSGGLSRSEAAARVYPDSDRLKASVAFRQTLLRLRKWLGDVVDSDKIELRPRGVWTLQETESADLVGRAYRHPLFESGPRPSGETSCGDDPFLPFVEGMRSMVSLDPDSARGVLVHATSVAESLPFGLCLELLSLVRPRSRTDPFAFEHGELEARVLLRMGRLDEADQLALRAHRIATHSRRHSLQRRAVAIRVFLALERGDMALAKALIHQIHGEGAHLSRLSRSVVIAFEWNMGNVSGALALAKSLAARRLGESRVDQLHYWSNAAVLASEVGDDVFLYEALDHAEGLLLPHLDPGPRENMALARANALTSSDPEQAISCLRAQAKSLEEKGWLMYRLYALEALALALASRGDLREAASTWHSAQRFRVDNGWRLTPRLAAMRRRALGNNL